MSFQNNLVKHLVTKTSFTSIYKGKTKLKYILFVLISNMKELSQLLNDFFGEICLNQFGLQLLKKT